MKIRIYGEIRREYASTDFIKLCNNDFHFLYDIDMKIKSAKRVIDYVDSFIKVDSLIEEYEVIKEFDGDSLINDLDEVVINNKKSKITRKELNVDDNTLNIYTNYNIKTHTYSDEDYNKIKSNILDGQKDKLEYYYKVKEEDEKEEISRNKGFMSRIFK